MRCVTGSPIRGSAEIVSECCESLVKLWLELFDPLVAMHRMVGRMKDTGHLLLVDVLKFHCVTLCLGAWSLSFYARLSNVRRRPRAACSSHFTVPGACPVCLAISGPVIPRT